MIFGENLIEKMRKFSLSIGCECDGCGRELFHYKTQPFCKDCLQEMLENNQSICEKCGRQTLAEGLCLSCKQRAPTFTQGFSCFVYKSKIAELINRMKNGDRYLAYYFADNMTKTFIEKYKKISDFAVDRYALNKKTDENALVILPIPLHEKDEKRRGYNQAYDLAKIVFHKLEKQGYRVVFDNETIIKTQETLSQKHLTLVKRGDNLKGAFHIHKRAFVKDKTILLIDDIMTTGATGNECALKLKNAGAKETLFLTIASRPELKPKN